jgi:hypothetical protein
MSHFWHVRYGRIAAMLVALAMFCAFPALAFGQDEEVDQDVTQENETEQEADASGGDGDGGSGGDGGIAANQNATCQQVAGGDASCSIDQSQSFGGDTFISRGGGDVDHDNGDNGVGGVVHDRGVAVGGGQVVSGGVGGGVTLARTGFDAWVLALVGGVLIAGGVGLLVAQRRGRLSS